jgi:YjbE family integral membrane protein
LIDVAAWVFLFLQIFFVDLLLGADNAIVIALACRKLPLEDARRAILLGAVGAIALRLVMILFANALLGVPLVKLVGAWTLVVIALNVQARNREGEIDAAGRAVAAGDFLSAAAVIMFADAAMSLDNVVALAAIAGGDLWLLAGGVLLSIPILAYGALILTQIIRHAPEILTLGAVILGWVAGEMAVSDPLVSGWIQTNTPALAALAPPLVAVFALLAGQSAKRTEAHTPARVTRPTPGPVPEPLSPRLEFRRASEPASDAAPLAVAPSAALLAEPPPVAAAPARGGWSEERVVVLGFVVLAAIAGLIIFVASLFDSLT